MDLLTPIAKGWMTEMANEITSQGIQIHGGMGFIEETGAAQFYRDARILAIYEGTTGIHANDLLFRKLLRNKGAGMTSLTQDIEKTVVAGRESSSDPINQISELLAEALEEHRQVTNLLLSQPSEHLESGAYDYLMMTGYTCAAWLLLKKAIVAVEKVQEDGSDKDFLDSKTHTAQFFCVNVLPRSTSHAKAISSELVLGSTLTTPENSL